MHDPLGTAMAVTTVPAPTNPHSIINARRAAIAQRLAHLCSSEDSTTADFDDLVDSLSFRDLLFLNELMLKVMSK